MAEPLAQALGRVRELLLDDRVLVRAVGAGRQRGAEPRYRRVELRYVDLKAGRHLQVTSYDATQAFTANHAGEDAARAVDDLLGEPYGNWHVYTVTDHLQLRVTKKREAMVHVSPSPDVAGNAAGNAGADAFGDGAREPRHSHDRQKARLLAPDDPVLRVLGLSDDRGRIRPSRQAKYRQVEEFLRTLGTAIDDATGAGALRVPTPDRPLTVVDLGCGNAYLTFAAHRYLSGIRGLPVRVVGVDVKAQSLEHNSAVARTLGVEVEATFVQGAIGAVELPDGVAAPDVVLALHACDTATDDALAQALSWEAPLVLAAPCCHHDVAARLRSRPGSTPYAALLRDGILRERFADTLTDALRAATLRLEGYRVDVVEFVESRHTPRNTLLRAVRTGAPATPAARAELDELVSTWHVTPRLRELRG